MEEINAKTHERTHERTQRVLRSTLAQTIALAESQKRACLVVLGGLELGSVIDLDEPRIVLGRDSSCRVILKDDGISRKHAEIVRDASNSNSVMVRDLGSTNGTFVGGARIDEAVLHDGDKVLLGRRTVLKFALQDEIESQYQKRIYESSTKDGLTGVYNRHYFDQKLALDLSFGRRHRLPMTLLMADIDNFKRVNDTYGHQVGDQVLIGVAQALAAAIRVEDALCRYGGEEFAIIALGTDAAGGKALAERLLRTVAEQRRPWAEAASSALDVTVSVGVATVEPGTRASSTALIGLADSSLYRAKNAGRNQAVAATFEGPQLPARE